MVTNLSTEWNIAREKRQDWLRQVGQERLVRAGKTMRGSSTKADRKALSGLRLWLVRRRAVS